MRSVFERLAGFGPVRRVRSRFMSEGLDFPVRRHLGADVVWIPPSCSTIRQVLANPVHAGACVYGKTRRERRVDATGAVRNRSRKLPRSEWSVLIHDHHPGCIGRQTREAMLERIAGNTRPRPHGGGGAVREGTGLLQGIAARGRCGRRLRTRYRGRTSSPGCHCQGRALVEGRHGSCLTIGAAQIDQTVAAAVPEAIRPASLEAALLAAERIETGCEQGLEQWRLAVERARCDSERAERRHRAVEPENRLVGRGLEAERERSLVALEDAQGELERRARNRPRRPADAERTAIPALGNDPQRAWNAPGTAARDRKELLRTVLEEVVVTAPRGECRARPALRRRGA